jgi:hypothetical protein
MYRSGLLALTAFFLAACGTTPPSAGREIIDEQTGNTLTVVSKPIVFARERTDVAAHARDYATLVAVEIDRSGTFENYLLLYRWSTVDKRMAPPPPAAMGDLELLGDGRVIELKALDSVPVSVGADRHLHLPRHGAAVVRAYRVDQGLLRFVAASRTLTLRLPQESFDVPFYLFEDGRAALGAFLQQTSAPQ